MYVLIDADKVPFKIRRLPENVIGVTVFAKSKKTVAKVRKQAKKRHTVETVNCRRDKLSAVMVGSLKEILRQTSDAAVMLCSPRKKVKRAAAALQAVYPEAQISVYKKLPKKTKLAPETEFVADEAVCARLPEALVPMLEQKTEWPPLPVCADEVAAPPAVVLPSAANEGCPTFQAAAAFIRRNRPKKKSDLGKALSERLNLQPLAVERLLVQLAEAGHIRVDAAENVRYR